MSSVLNELTDDWRRVLAVVAHPDDLEYGASGAIARWAAKGADVGYVLATCGEAGIDSLRPDIASRVRRDEQLAAAAVVGVTSVEFLDHPDGQIADALRLRRDVAAAIRRHQPEVLVTLTERHRIGAHLNSPDHRMVGTAVLDAVADAANRWIFPELGKDGLGPWAGVRAVCLFASPCPTHFVDITDQLQAAVASLACHRAYLAALGSDPAEVLVPAARETGQQVGVGAAVSVEVVWFGRPPA
jgi:LmbE family N-acetylglucosaminyl deacetylase